jgi:hypothetical protein
LHLKEMANGFCFPPHKLHQLLRKLVERFRHLVVKFVTIPIPFIRSSLPLIASSGQHPINPTREQVERSTRPCWLFVNGSRLSTQSNDVRVAPMRLTIRFHPKLEFLANLESKRGASACFCRMTQYSFLRLLTLKALFEEDTMTNSQAIAAYRLLRQASLN